MNLHLNLPDAAYPHWAADHRAEMIGILREARLSLKQLPLAAAEYLATLHTQGLTRVCALLAPFLPEL